MTEKNQDRQMLLEAYKKLANVSRSRKATSEQRQLARTGMKRITTQYLDLLEDDLVTRTELFRQLADELQQLVDKLKHGPITLAVRRLHDFVEGLTTDPSQTFQN